MTKKWITAAILMAILLGILASYLLNKDFNRDAMFPAYSWHVEGQVFDKSSNPLADVSVVVSGTVRVTAINALSTIPPRTLRLETKTDREGKFAFNIQGAFFELVFSKPGFVGKSLPFGHYSDYVFDDTNQVLRVYLEPK